MGLQPMSSIQSGVTSRRPAEGGGRDNCLTTRTADDRFPHYLLAASAAAAIVGTFLLWYSVHAPPSINRPAVTMIRGIGTDGTIVLILAVIVAIGSYFSFSRRLGRVPLFGLLDA